MEACDTLHIVFSSSVTAYHFLSFKLNVLSQGSSYDLKCNFETIECYSLILQFFLKF